MSCQVGDVPFSDKVVRFGTHLECEKRRNIKSNNEKRYIHIRN